MAMESYKHSCPFCGQHIEYTIGYCGKQMVCPICGKTVTFPAIPPGGKGKTLHIKHTAAAPAAKWSFSLDGILGPLRQFKHWNTVLACLVPFVIVGALLAGASVLKKQAGNETAAPVAPIQADPNAWQKMTDLARAEQLVQERLAALNRIHALCVAADQNRANLHAYYHGQTLDQATHDSVQHQYRNADQAVMNAQQAEAAARESFENAYQNYQKLGGTVDYRQQLPH
jgi:hypothetical protein